MSVWGCAQETDYIEGLKAESKLVASVSETFEKALESLPREVATRPNVAASRVVFSDSKRVLKNLAQGDAATFVRDAPATLRKMEKLTNDVSARPVKRRAGPCAAASAINATVLCNRRCRWLGVSKLEKLT